MDQKQVISWPASNTMGPIHSACREVSDVALLTASRGPSFTSKGRCWVQPRPSQDLANSASFWSLFSTKKMGTVEKWQQLNLRNAEQKWRLSNFLKITVVQMCNLAWLGDRWAFKFLVFFYFFFPLFHVLPLKDHISILFQSLIVVSWPAGVSSSNLVHSW